MPYHIPVLKNETIDALNIKEGKIYLDGTMGGGGHSEEILKKNALLIGVDRDIDAINECKNRFNKTQYDGNYIIIKDNFKNIKSIFDDKDLLINKTLNQNNDNTKIPKINSVLIQKIENGQKPISGAMLDLGFSSHQIDEPSRGMSFRFDAPLDMRMDTSSPLTAEQVINEYPTDQLIKILFEYGDEKFARKIISNINRVRQSKRIETTAQLSDIVKSSIPKKFKNEAYPEKKVFQAIRIEVNSELEGLEKSIYDIFDLIESGGRLCIISFHSLEHRIVKKVFADLTADCVCDKSLPVCVCNHKKRAIAFKKVPPSAAELKENSKSASATLRYIEKI
ncbi:MAG: 16S rRNA (cytosine(1402)-N(4))-methyltransferase RsmH [Firmicutes bacterium]|nr:16S rRNA (cytosine(1402)-N(4))-methyltransferase RsmH [Bacillota bacterium]